MAFSALHAGRPRRKGVRKSQHPSPCGNGSRGDCWPGWRTSKRLSPLAREAGIALLTGPRILPLIGPSFLHHLRYTSAALGCKTATPLGRHGRRMGNRGRWRRGRGQICFLQSGDGSVQSVAFALQLFHNSLNIQRSLPKKVITSQNITQPSISRIGCREFRPKAPDCRTLSIKRLPYAEIQVISAGGPWTRPLCV